jgi:hypothetical protein
MSNDRISSQIRIEMRTIQAMMALFCRKQHGIKQGLCPQCSDLYQYCLYRLAHCPRGENKPVCAQCAIHCYAPDYRERIRQVMRFSGPRMVFRHPWLALHHLTHQLRSSLARENSDHRGT